VSPDGVGLEGTLAAIAGQRDPEDHVRRMVQQAFRAGSGRDEYSPYNAWFTAEALYQQLVGSWTEADVSILTRWRTDSWAPEFVEGRYLQDRRLSDKAQAELKRLEPYP
jgi:hypothetical protein